MQWTFFPGGMVWENGEVRTGANCLEFFELGDAREGESRVVDLTGIEPVTS